METLIKNSITETHLEKAMSYKNYRELLENLLAEGKTTGTNQTEALLQYAILNLQRMGRAEKTTVLSQETKESLDKLDKKLVWVVLTEGWCGDAALSVPALAKIADYSEKIDLKILLRDENLDVMDSHLTNGGRAIPKLICLEADTLKELFVWGPRPQAAQNLFLELKAAGKDYAPEIQKWYAKDRSESIQAELLTLIKGL